MQPHQIIDTASPRYGFDPKLPFAATLAGAERRRMHAAVAASPGRARRTSAWRIVGRLARLGVRPTAASAD